MHQYNSISISWISYSFQHQNMKIKQFSIHSLIHSLHTFIHSIHSIELNKRIKNKERTIFLLLMMMMMLFLLFCCYTVSLCMCVSHTNILVFCVEVFIIQIKIFLFSVHLLLLAKLMVGHTRSINIITP